MILNLAPKLQYIYQNHTVGAPNRAARVQEDRAGEIDRDQISRFINCYRLPGGFHLYMGEATVIGWVVGLLID